MAAAPRLDTVRSLPEQVQVVTPQEILTADCDVLAPCGPPGVIDEGVVERLRCAVICGAANNALASPSSVHCSIPEASSTFLTSWPMPEA